MVDIENRVIFTFLVSLLLKRIYENCWRGLCERRGFLCVFNYYGCDLVSLEEKRM